MSLLICFGCQKKECDTGYTGDRCDEPIVDLFTGSYVATDSGISSVYPITISSIGAIENQEVMLSNLRENYNPTLPGNLYAKVNESGQLFGTSYGKYTGIIKNLVLTWKNDTLIGAYEFDSNGLTLTSKLILTRQ